jgi:hypothetical protein
MGLGSFFRATRETFQSGFRRGAEGAKWVLEWMWKNPELAGNLLSLAAQTIPGADVAVSAGFTAAGKVVDMGKKITEGTKLTKSVKKAEARLNKILKKE